MGSYKSKKLCVMVAFDVRNPFNTHMTFNYFENRTLVTGEEYEERRLRMEVPQGSLIGPLLCNVLSDGILTIISPDIGELDTRIIWLSKKSCKP